MCSNLRAFIVRVECRAEKNPGCAFTWAELCSAAVLPHLHPGWAHQAKPLCTHTAQQVCPAAPARWEPGASAACRDLPLAWTRTHLITASFNYCASLPKGFQPSLLLKSHSCKFLASLSHMVAAAGASLYHVHWRTNRKLTQKWLRLGLIKLEICVWILLWWIWSHSAHYKADVGHLLETRGVAHYLPFSLVPPCYHVREVDLSKYVPAQSGHLGWKLAWVRSHEMQREKWKGEIRSLRWSQQPKSQTEFSSSRKDSR